jgi:hypothetical protein
MNEWTIYLWTRLDGVVETSIAFSIIFAIASILITIGYYATAEEKYLEKEHKILGKFLPIVPMIFVASILLALFVPSSKEYAMIKVLPKLSNSEISQQIQKDMPEMYTLAKDALKEMLVPKKTEK